MKDFAKTAALAAEELGAAVQRIEPETFSAMVEELALARRIAIFGVGREGLMMRALAMRLYHLGLDAHMVGDMSTPPVGIGDLLVVSAGPGSLSTVNALIGVAKDAGARVLCITAQPQGAAPRASDRVLVIPAQTMADDQAPAPASILPMGSLFEGAQFLAFELVILALRERIGADTADMRARHTNLE